MMRPAGWQGFHTPYGRPRILDNEGECAVAFWGTVDHKYTLSKCSRMDSLVARARCCNIESPVREAVLTAFPLNSVPWTVVRNTHKSNATYHADVLYKLLPK